MLTTFVLGSVHAFSVLLAPLEAKLGLPRAQVSLVYSFALVAITLSVTVGYRIYAALAAWWLVSITTLGAATGLWLAATATGWWALFAGYSLAFGICNGIGYGFALQLAGRAMPARRGFAMGAVTAAYALGSILFAQVIAWRIGAGSVASAFIAIALAVLVLGLAAALMLRLAGARYDSALAFERSAASRNEAMSETVRATVDAAMQASVAVLKRDAQQAGGQMQNDVPQGRKASGGLGMAAMGQNRRAPN